MITIISENSDIASNEVIENLISLNIPFIRKNEVEFYAFSYNIQNEEIKESNVFWHRRGQLYLNPKEILIRELAGFVTNEELIINYSFEKINKKINNFYIGGVFDEDVHEKVLDLYIAKECGLKIPETLITNIKEDLVYFKNKYERIITKPIKNPYIYIEKEEIYFTSHNFLIEDNHIEQVDDYFAISKFQEYIEKEIEIRVFYFDKVFFSMAIFSQNNDKTKIDYRNYNVDKQNKEVPFTLPKYVERKLKKILKKKNINTCSIDLILTPENEFVFLEINPQGQFGWLSKNCNYYIEEFIAQKLIANEKVNK